MQYADIITLHPASYEPWTYEIPAAILADLTVGSVVLVPAAGRNVHGVVSRFRRSRPESVNEIKAIDRVIYAGPFLSSQVIEMARHLATVRGLPIGPILEQYLPPLLLRRQKDTFADHKELSVALRAKVILGPASSRLKYWRAAINRAQQQKKAIFVCMPSLAATWRFVEEAELQKVTIMSSEVTDAEKRKIYIRLRYGDPLVVIGTRLVMGLPTNNCAAVIIEEPFLPGHKNEQNGRLWTYEQGLAVNRACHMPVLFGMTLPFIDSSEVSRLETKTLAVGSPTITILHEAELATQLTDLISRWPNETVAIVVREQRQAMSWCRACVEARPGTIEVCPRCQATLVPLPQVTRQWVESCVGGNSVSVLTSDGLPLYRRADRVIAIGFDALQVVTDYRADWYRTLTYSMLRQLAEKECVIITRHPVETEALVAPQRADYIATILDERRRLSLPPYRQIVRLTATTAKTWSKLRQLLANQSIVGTFKTDAGRVVTMSLAPNAHVPTEWSKIAGVKVDCNPGYIE